MEYTLVGCCGLYCGACDLFLAEPRKCGGCKSRSAAACTGACPIRRCARRKKHATCAACSRRPCAILQAFAQSWPHRRAAVRNLEVISHMGVEQWTEAQTALWRCPRCDSRFGWYDGICPRCGAEVGGLSDEDEAAGSPAAPGPPAKLREGQFPALR